MAVPGVPSWGGVVSSLCVRSPPSEERFISGPTSAETPQATFGCFRTVILLDYTRFEKARIVGARALQLSMGAPPLIELAPEVRNPVQVAMAEYAVDAIPLTVQRTKTHQVKQ